MLPGLLGAPKAMHFTIEDAAICCGILQAVETTQERATCGSAAGGAIAGFFLAVNFRITT